MSVNSRYRKERPYAAAVLNSQRQVYETAVQHPDDYDPQHAIPSAQFAIAYAILDLSDAIREHTKETA